MLVFQAQWSGATGWSPVERSWDLPAADVVFVFASGKLLRENSLLESLQRHSPKAVLFGCSTAGEILGNEVRDDTVAATFVQFSDTRAALHAVPVAEGLESRQAGICLGQAIDPEGLVHVIVLSDGLHVNGTELVLGLRESLPAGTLVTGGLAADGDRFSQTEVLVDGAPRSGMVTALALYGSSLQVGCGSMGGWDQFGPERRITRSKGSILYELDGKSALGLYKSYLGEHAKELPASGLLFPLGIRAEHQSRTVVRTILGVSEEDQSLTFAGDMPEGWYARLMHANFDRLVDGALGAARSGRDSVGQEEPELALLISCVGRKLILKQRVEEEIEAVREAA